MPKLLVPVCGLLFGLSLLSSAALGEEYMTGIKWDVPTKVTPGEGNRKPPSDATVLFDGTNMDQWNGGGKWKVEDGVATVSGGGISTKQEFGDCQLHIEWSAPNPPKGEGQDCGNSGVFMMGKYEVQVLDSFTTDTYPDGQAGALYKQRPPAVNVVRKPGEWNTYDILWTCPRFDETGELVSPAYVTVMHNGVLLHNHLELLGQTLYHRPPPYEAHEPKGPISLQDHGSPVRYRNIWIREFKKADGKQVREPYIRNGSKKQPVKGTPRLPKVSSSDLSSVSGTVLMNGQPLASGTITFSPSEGDAKLSTSIGKDGQFTLSPQRLAPGSYSIAIKSDSKEGVAAVPAKYQSSESSGITIDTQPGENDLRLELVAPE